MYVPDSTRKSGLRRQAYPSLDTMLAAWRTTWGDAKRRQGRTVGDLLDGALAECAERKNRGDLAAATLADYTRCHGSLRPVWADVLVEDVDVPMLYRWRDLRGQAGRVRANRERSFLFEALQLGVRQGNPKDNPVRYLERFTEKPRDRYVTDDEFMAVFNVAPAVVQAAMLLAAVTGMRQADILRVRRSDFGDNGLTVRTSKTGKTMVYGWTEGMRRAVLVAVGAREFIPLNLIATEKGNAYTGDGFRTLWHRAMIASGLENRFTFHDLRAKAGSESRDWKLLGHLDQRTFERVYNRLPRQVTPAR